jgi:hypothetical protein
MLARLAPSSLLSRERPAADRWAAAHEAKEAGAAMSIHGNVAESHPGGRRSAEADDESKVDGYRSASRPGKGTPVDQSRCDGKEGRLVVRPFDAFDVARMSDEQYSRLPLLAELGVANQRIQVGVKPRADASQGCGFCVVSSTEQAISIIQVAAPFR